MQLFSLLLNQGTDLDCSDDNFSNTNGGIELLNETLSDKIEIFPSINDNKKFFSLENILSGPGIEKLYEEKFERKLSSEKIISSALDRNKDELFIIENFLKTLVSMINDLVLSFSCEKVILGGSILNTLKPILMTDKILDYFPSEINPKYAELIERTQVDLLTEDEPGIFGCLALFKTK